MGFSIAKESFSVSFPTIVIASLLFALDFRILGTILFAIFLFELYFFRDPDRVLPDLQGGAILSPADGKIIKVEGTKISIFMSLFDVHVNRSPVGGKIEEIIYRKGGFSPAFLDDAQRENERNTIVVQTGHGAVAFTQIAGIIARRIVCRVRLGDCVKAGDRIGMIRFGSRVDLEMPNDVTMNISIGAQVKSGTSVIAMARSAEKK